MKLSHLFLSLLFASFMVAPISNAVAQNTQHKVVPLDYSKRAFETYNSRSKKQNNVTLKIIDKAGHGFKPEERVLSNQYVKEFLSK